MDNPPPNYNPNESVLSGGINSSSPISIVQGGGGVLDGHNETTSVLEGGINSSTPITMIQGGGAAENNIQIVKNYNMLDKTQYDAFIAKFSKTGNFTNPTAKIKELIKKKYKETFLHYRKSGTYIESSSLNSRNTTNIIKIKFIPSTTKTLILLPPTDDPMAYINQIMFLINNQYLRITTKNEFILNPNIFVISLAPFNTNSNLKTKEILQYFYNKIKLSNLHSYYYINETVEDKSSSTEPLVFILRKEMEGKKGILIAESGFKLLNPINPDSLSPFDYDLINEEGIQTIKYKGDASKVYENIYMIANGDDPETTIMNDYTFTLKTNIAVLDLIDEDIQTITIDLQGNKYRIRLPLTPNKTLDKVYNDWDNKKYSNNEMELIKNLDLQNIEGLDIPQFLFHLSYFKCFDDTSLLSKQECTYMKDQLQKVYLHSLKKHENDIERSTANIDNRVYVSHECRTMDVSTGTIKVDCTVKYRVGLNEGTTTVEINEKYIPILKSTKDEDIKAIKEAVLAEFYKEN
jgi:hypothetical protein